MAYRRILVGTDGSDPSLVSVREAAQMARAVGAELLVVCAYEPADETTMEKWRDEAPPEIWWRFKPTSMAEAATEKGRRVAEEVGVEARTVIEQGEAGDALIRVAARENADLMIVGNRGMSGATRFLLGSVPNKVSHHAPCDLLIVKTVR